MKITLEQVNLNCLTLIAGFIIGYAIGSCSNKKEITASPIEKEIIEQLTVTRDSTLSAITKLDSIKDAEVIKVIELNNDSTLLLFKQLVSE